MYSWDDSMEDWARPGAYSFDSARAAARAEEAARARASGPRQYHDRKGPDWALVDPSRKLATKTQNPLVIAVDVTGSMRHWPLEIFDRLPLLYNTLSQYRPDLEVCFAAIGDAHYDRWPLQVSDFARGFRLETQLKALYGEGGGGDEPESYELFAHWLNTHVDLAPCEEKPFLIVFGDAPMHPEVRPDQVASLLGDTLQSPLDAKSAWRRVTQTWNTWFLRRQGERSDRVQKQWREALGHEQILHIEDEPRAVDFAMGLIARHWGRFSDFQRNMQARQDAPQIEKLVHSIEKAWSWRHSRRTQRKSRAS